MSRAARRSGDPVRGLGLKRPDLLRDAAFVGVTLHESRGLGKKAADQPFIEIRERLTARR